MTLWMAAQGFISYLYLGANEGTENKCLYDESMEPEVGKRVEAEGWQ